MKLERHAAILRLVRERRLENQHELREALATVGIAVTQATLSRDLRELGLVKQADPSGGAFYVAPREAPGSPGLQSVLGPFLIGMDGHDGLLVLRTTPGGASAVAAALDSAALPGVLGTIAGRDTVLVITRGETARREVMGVIEKGRP
ncbi:MAG: arginine repressor [Gemmatimonadales bacterium]